MSWAGRARAGPPPGPWGGRAAPVTVAPGASSFPVRRRSRCGVVAPAAASAPPASGAGDQASWRGRGRGAGAVACAGRTPAPAAARRTATCTTRITRACRAAERAGQAAASSRQRAASTAGPAASGPASCGPGRVGNEPGVGNEPAVGGLVHLSARQFQVGEDHPAVGPEEARRLAAQRHLGRGRSADAARERQAAGRRDRRGDYRGADFGSCLTRTLVPRSARICRAASGSPPTTTLTRPSLKIVALRRGAPSDESIDSRERTTRSASCSVAKANSVSTKINFTCACRTNVRMVASNEG